jgi:UDP-N-acetylmuramoyl-tripeptide--D-alanyl-D-alanine ligase
MSRGKQRRTWAVLGPMAELGDDTRDAHMELGRFVVRLDVSRLVVVGPEAGGIHAGAVLEGSWGEESVHVDDADAAVALLREEVAAGDVVLVKASRSAGLERVAAALLEETS